MPTCLQVLHCDPHPGNLLRTPSGELCILDWGLVTTIRDDLQLTLIEHVAHLVAKDYGKVPSGLVPNPPTQTQTLTVTAALTLTIRQGALRPHP